MSIASYPVDLLALGGKPTASLPGPNFRPSNTPACRYRHVRRQFRLHPRQLTSRAAVGGEGGDGAEDRSGSEGSAEEEARRLREQARLLNDLFYSKEAPGEGEAGSSAAAAADETSATSTSSSSAAGNTSRTPTPTMIPDLPLWRVQWAALPGNQEVLHVHVPHYCAMFERLFRQQQPWRYGHLYLPEGSKNLGNPQYALEPGSQAPLCGTLMEVLQAVRFADGRLIILAVGVGRFRVLGPPTQDVPYSRADVELLCDAEEQQQFEGLAVQALESVQGGLPGSSSGSGSGSEVAAAAEVPLTSLMSALPAAARESAAAYAQAWLDYELSEARQQDERLALIDGSRSEDATVLGRRLAALAGNDVLPMPFYDALLAAAEAEWEQGGASAPGAAEAAEVEVEAESGPSSSSGGALQQAVDDLRPVLRRTEAAAYSLASSAAASCLARQVQQQRSSNNSCSSGSSSASESAGGGGSVSGGTPVVLNTTTERGIVPQSPEEILGEAALTDEPDSLALALRLEAAVWQEIDAIHALATKLRNKAAPLPDGLRCLQAMQLSQPAAEGEAGGNQQRQEPQAGVHPDYPTLRRLQRLSFGVSALLANVSAAEGRQAWVEAGSICARLRLALAALTKHRQVLVALVAVEGL